MAILPTGIGPVTGGYQIERSLRMRYGASAYLSRGMSTANTTTWTVSFWFKTGLSQSIGSGYGTIPSVFESVETTGAGRQLGISQTNAGGTFQISFYKYAPSTYTMRKIPAMVFRDPSAWYHAVFVWNTTSAVAEDRAQIWINGTRVTAWTTNTNPAQNEAWLWSMFTNQFIGPQNRDNGTVIYPWDGYLTEVNFIDGQALTPSSFGETDASTGVWTPKKYAGTYGTNGFYLKFADNSGTTSTTLGKDSSGNGNNWTPNNFSVTAGVGNDSLVDTPTPYGTDTGAGGEVRGNYAVVNPLSLASSTTLSEANLKGVSSTFNNLQSGTVAVSSGKWYWELTFGGSLGMVGIVPASAPPTTDLGYTATSYGYRSSNGSKYNNGSATAYGNTYTTNDVIGVALDLDNGKLFFSKNNTWQNSGDPAAGTNAAFTGLSGSFMPAAGTPDTTAATWYWNFGQRPFAYTAPSGYKALCTQNLPTPTIGATSTTQANDYFNAVLYTGNGNTYGTGGQNITGVGFQPDLVWIKSRNNIAFHGLWDAVRGTGKYLGSNTTAAESGNSGDLLSAFNSDGFNVNTTYLGGPNETTNQNTWAYVAWNWKANGAGSTNTAGTITSTVSANTTAGFSIVTYTGNSTSGATVGHGLGVSPNMVIIKARTAGSVEHWPVYHSSLTTGQFLILNITNAAQAADGTFNSSTPVSSTVFQFGSPVNTRTNSSSYAYVAYCFAEVAGYSKFGSYTGNGSADGPFVFCGFRPRWLMFKRTDSSGWWYVWDSVRQTFNLMGPALFPNDASAESVYPGGASLGLDLLSNGFKLRGSQTEQNASGGTYIFAAFAESPFKYSLAR